LQVGEEEENVRYVEKEKKNKSSPSLPYTPSTTTPTQKKRKLKKHWTNTVAKKKDPHLLPTSPFLCCCFSALSLCVVDERTSLLYNMYICPFAIID
jgi:hypothetical protein